MIADECYCHVALQYGIYVESRLPNCMRPSLKMIFTFCNGHYARLKRVQQRGMHGDGDAGLSMLNGC